jgi:uncharacterized protein (TIGR03084 family)
MSDLNEVVDDLAAEQLELDSLLNRISAEQWDLVTPAAPWTIRDTISHLAFFDERQTQAILDPQGFADEINQRMTGGTDQYMDIGIARGREMPPAAVLTWWRQAREAEIAAFVPLDPQERLPWFGPPMRAASAVAARIMETWAHGQDVYDTLGESRAPTTRLFHVAELGVKTFSWSFSNRGLDVPDSRVRVALQGPDGTERAWNEESTEAITGPVEDFCLVVAQRRHHLDTDLAIVGEVARRWMEIAQVFAGPPGPGRLPTQRTIGS